MGLYGNKFLNKQDSVDLLEVYFNEFDNMIKMFNSEDSILNEYKYTETEVKINIQWDSKIKKVLDKIFAFILDILKKAGKILGDCILKFSGKRRKKKGQEVKKKMATNGNVGNMQFDTNKQFVFESDIATNTNKQDMLVQTCQNIQKNLFIYFDSEDFMKEDMDEYKRGIYSISDMLLKAPDFSLYAKLDENIVDNDSGMMEIHKKLLQEECIQALDFNALNIDFTTGMRNCTAVLLRSTAEEEIVKLNTANSIVDFLSEYDNDIEVCKDNLDDIQEAYMKLKVTMEKCFNKREIENGENGEYLPYYKGKDLKLVQSILKTIKLDAKIVNYLCTIATKSEMFKTQYLEKINQLVA